ncbi:MAG: tryptophan 2,3-dioxygenase family protein [Bacteroidota bacterium]|nr:tryptophan 2,3-dioxygenase family protein [Bacteroidota bacterium]
MSEKNIDTDLTELISKLKSKYEENSQDFKAYLEGLLYQDFTSYWDYIQVDTLLSLQKPKTKLKDESIFIMYHQITELYFKLCLHEFEQLAELKGKLKADFFAMRVKRINAYFRNLTNSFEIMVDGMEKEQFLKFRMSLLPASGFQSAQYRMIEICSANFLRLVDKDHRGKFSEQSNIEEMFEFIYWKAGATEIETGKKTLTLTQFEAKYAPALIKLANDCRDCNLWALYKGLPEAEKQNVELITQLKKLDQNVNVNWPLIHYKSAVRYLQKHPSDVAATGGTNWQKYLPPRFQVRVFFPELWNAEELSEWGKSAFLD